MKVCINGHEWVKRQLAKEGIAFEALDNGVLSCQNPPRLQKLCDSLDSEKIDAVFRKWLARLPHPFRTEDRAAGYRYDLSILQAEPTDVCSTSKLSAMTVRSAKTVSKR